MIPPRTLIAFALLLLVTAPSLLAQEAAPFSEQPAPQRSPAPVGRVFMPAETLAVVGDQHILVGDMLGEINQMLAPYIGKHPEEEVEEQRQKLIQQMLPSVVENKILYLEFLRNVPPERIPDIRKKMSAEFDEEKLEIAMQRAKVNSQQELDALLRKYGSSLEKQRRTYMEQKLGRAMLGQKIDFQPEISHDEMLAYYHDHAAEFEITPKARWEQLSVRFDKHPSKEAAWAKMAAMGNEILRGAPFAAVAKKHSEATCASDGGQHDWITRGSLASQPLDDAIFQLPPGRLSPILEDERGFHIVRVLERTEAGRTDFVSAQAGIKETLKKQKVQEEVADYVAKLKAKTRVWTVFDEEADATLQAQQSDRFTSPR